MRTPELERILWKLSMVSHVTAASLEPSSPSSDEDIGGRRPTGALDRKGDRVDGYRQKTAEHFQAQLRRGRPERLVLEDAREALDAWQRTPLPREEPPKEHPRWKQWIAESDESGKELARRFSVSSAYISQVRKMYRE